MFLKFKMQLLPTEKSVLIQKRDGFNSVIYGIYSFSSLSIVLESLFIILFLN